MLEEIFFVVRREINNGNYPNFFKKNVNDVIERVRSNEEDTKIENCLKNLVFYMKNKPRSYAIENPNAVFAKCSTTFFAMYATNENIVDIDKSVIFDVLNAMSNASDLHFNYYSSIFTNPTFMAPLIELNSNSLNYYEDNVRLITNELTSGRSYPSIESFIENYMKPRLHPEVEDVKKIEKIKSFMLQTISNQDSLHPDWKIRFDEKKHLIEELDNMYGRDLKALIWYDNYLHSNKCPAHHITNDELVVINICRYMNIFNYKTTEIDALIDKVHKLPLDQYGQALASEIMESKMYWAKVNTFDLNFGEEYNDTYLNDASIDLDIESSKSR